MYEYWKSAANIAFRHESLTELLVDVFSRKIAKEFHLLNSNSMLNESMFTLIAYHSKCMQNYVELC